MSGTPLIKCGRCGKLFPKARLAVCKECAIFEEEDYSKVRDVMHEIGVATPAQAAERANVELGVVIRMIEVGMISFDRPTDEVKCGRCGKPAMSVSKRLCEQCMMKLDIALGNEKRKIASEIDKIREASAREVFESKRRGQT